MRVLASILCLFALYGFTFKPGIQGEWKLVSLNDESWPVASNVPTMNIDVVASTISGNDGCNQYNGQVESFDEQHIKFEKVMSTMMHCEGVPYAAFHEALLSVSSYSISPEGLMLMRDDGETVMTLVPHSEEDEPTK